MPQESPRTPSRPLTRTFLHTAKYGYNGLMKTANVSDLKNNLSAHLKSVAAGEPLVITNHRKPIAVVYPLDQELMDDHMRSLVAEGVVHPPRKHGKLDVKAFLAMPKGECGASLTEAVLEERSEGR